MSPRWGIGGKLSPSLPQPCLRWLAKPWECACVAPPSDMHLERNGRIFRRLESREVFEPLELGLRLFRARVKLSYSMSRCKKPLTEEESFAQIAKIRDLYPKVPKASLDPSRPNSRPFRSKCLSLSGASHRTPKASPTDCDALKKGYELASRLCPVGVHRSF